MTTHISVRNPLYSLSHPERNIGVPPTTLQPYTPFRGPAPTPPDFLIQDIECLKKVLRPVDPGLCCDLIAIGGLAAAVMGSGIAASAIVGDSLNRGVSSGLYVCLGEGIGGVSGAIFSYFASGCELGEDAICGLRAFHCANILGGGIVAGGLAASPYIGASTAYKVAAIATGFNIVTAVGTCALCAASRNPECCKKEEEAPLLAVAPAPPLQVYTVAVQPEDGIMTRE